MYFILSTRKQFTVKLIFTDFIYELNSSLPYGQRATSSLFISTFFSSINTYLSCGFYYTCIWLLLCVFIFIFNVFKQNVVSYHKHRHGYVNSMCMLHVLYPPTHQRKLNNWKFLSSLVLVTSPSFPLQLFILLLDWNWRNEQKNEGDREWVFSSII